MILHSCSGPLHAFLPSQVQHSQDSKILSKTLLEQEIYNKKKIKTDLFKREQNNGEKTSESKEILQKFYSARD